jgi:SAM-dependent methyltransferase
MNRRSRPKGQRRFSRHKPPSDPVSAASSTHVVRRPLSTRENLCERSTESWRPPLYAPPLGRLRRTMTAVRRGFDLQAASIWRHLVSELRAVEGTVLDVGCGAQPYRPLLPRGVHYVGIDTERAGEDFGYTVPDTTYFKGDEWPVESASVDVVLCTETLEHVLEPLKFLAEAHRCLRPGGRLLMTVPFAARWHFVPYDYWRFTPSGLQYLLEQSGFTGIAVYARGNAATVAAYKVMALFLPLLLPQSRGLVRQLVRVFALASIPIVVLAALIGRLTLLGRGGDDCLGYTVVADRPADARSSAHS